MSAQALLSVIAPAVPHAPQGLAAIDASAFEMLLVGVVGEGESAPTVADDAAPDAPSADEGPAAPSLVGLIAAPALILPSASNDVLPPETLPVEAGPNADAELADPYAELPVSIPAETPTRDAGAAAALVEAQAAAALAMAVPAPAPSTDISLAPPAAPANSPSAPNPDQGVASSPGSAALLIPAPKAETEVANPTPVPAAATTPPSTPPPPPAPVPSQTAAQPLKPLAERTASDESGQATAPPSSDASKRDTAVVAGAETEALGAAKPTLKSTEASAVVSARDPGTTPDGAAPPSLETDAAAETTPQAARDSGGPSLSRATIDATVQVAAQILRKLEGRSTRFEMALLPEELGRVDIKLDIDSEGRLAARLAFDNPAAATDLRGRADELRRQLEAQGFHLAEDAFEFTERDSGSHRFDRGHDPRGGQARAFASAARLNAEIDAAPPCWVALSLSPSGVDLKV